jgi:hypothetical protein
MRAFAIVAAAASPAHATPPAGRPYLATSPPIQTASAFFLGELRDKIVGDWDAAWRTLYPLHQRVASRADFVSCERATPFRAQLQGVRVTGVRKSLVRIPGLARPTAGVAVHVRVALRWYGPRDPIVLWHTFHLVPVAGRWRWLLSAERYRFYRDGGCASILAAGAQNRPRQATRAPGLSSATSKYFLQIYPSEAREALKGCQQCHDRAADSRHKIELAAHELVQYLE